MTLREKQSLFLVMVSKLTAFMTIIGKQGFVNEWYRTRERQAQLVAEGKSWTFNSKHLDGLAVDIILLKDGKPCWDNEDYKPLGEFWEKLGGRWGGSWKQRDSVHFEYAG